jgi:hypothetical protein
MSHEVIVPVSGSAHDFHRMYLGDAVVVVAVAAVTLEVDTCCGCDNACSCNDCFLSRRFDECEAEEETKEKESTTLPKQRHTKNRAICIQAIIRRRKGER